MQRTQFADRSSNGHAGSGSRNISFELPPIKSAADAVQAAAAVVSAVAAGEITPSEAGDIGKLIDGYVRALEAADFDERLSKLERVTSQ